MTKQEGIVLGVAGRLFREKGFAATTVRELATAAGMLPGSLHYRFPTKESLLVELMERGMMQAIERVRAAIEVENTPLKKMRSALREHLSILVEGDDAIYVNLYEFRSVTGTARDRILRLRDAYEALWDGMLHAAVGAGLIRAGVDLRMVRFLLLGAVNWSAQWYEENQSYTPEEVADAFFSISAFGFCNAGVGGLLAQSAERPEVQLTDAFNDGDRSG